MERTPAKTSCFLGATVPSLQSIQIMHLDSPDSDDVTPHFHAASSGYNSSTLSTLISEDDGHSSTVMSSSDDAHLSRSRESLPRANGRPSMEGRSHMDFLAKLECCTPALRKILEYLSPRDLAAVCRTSQAWRKVCRSVEELRWRTYIKGRQEHWESSKENIYDGRAANLKPSLHAIPLTDYNRGAEQQQVAEPVKSRVEVFAEEGKYLKDGEWNWPCPLCKYPSVVSNAAGVAKCKSSACGYQFCPKCHGDFHLPRPCTVHCVPTNPRTKKNIIGSKHSKLQLRRL